jgi:beta-galactosidase
MKRDDAVSIVVTRAAKVIIGLIAVLIAPSLHSQTIQTPAAVAPEVPTLLLGAAWYPEQWPESRWGTDLDLMQKTHLHLVRIGEFAWSSLEPEENRYELDWMERAIDLAGKHGIYVVIGTPSAAPPAWLTQKYPETLRMLQTGQSVEHGERQQFNWANPKYRELVRRIDEQLAKRFGHNPYVIGWQIDNEYREVSFDSDTHRQFQDWLQARYGTLDNLNRRWATSYWSQTYSSWDQIPIETDHGNPGLLLSWKRFVTDTWRSYQRNQIDAIRRYADARQRITTNMMGWFDGYDHYTVSRDLDFAAWDDPIGQGHFDPVRNGAAHDLTRGFKHKNFWVMETTAGPTGWAKINTMLDKGEMRALLWHDVGHGADAASYWQWRDALNGEEQNHGSLVDVDGTPDPLYSEFAQVGLEFEKAGPFLKETSVQSEVAIIHSYESRWTLDWQKLHKSYDPIDELLSYYKPLHELGVSIDIVSPLDDLSRYKLVVAPGLNVLPQSVADNLIRYVQQGGNLVLGQNSAMKDEDNARWPQRQPGPLADLIGGRVEQYFALMSGVSVAGIWGSNEGQLYAEQLQAQAPDSEVLMRYGEGNSWLADAPAAITRKVGHGTITYIGIWMNEAGMRTAAQWMLATSGVTPEFSPVPEGIEVYRRVGSGKTVFIVENLSKGEQTVPLPRAFESVLDGVTVHSVTLPVYGVAVLAAEP